MNNTIRVFISYSWSSPEHQDWVISLANRLANDGVDVCIDKWDLKEGHDKYSFMESMVKSNDIKKVLIILDEKYVEKAQHRIGGVGIEAQIISPEIYENVSQEKFIPIVAQRNDQGEPYFPIFLKSRIYIDLSQEQSFEDNYEKLLRNLFERPAYSKPVLGKPPSYLFENTPMTHRTSSILRSFDNQINKNPKKIDSLVQEFLNEFLNDLKGYTLKIQQNDMLSIGKLIYDNLNSYTSLRNDFLIFVEKIAKSEYVFDVDGLIKFFEQLAAFKSPLDDRSSWSSTEFDNFRFIIHELFLYTIAITLRNNNYKLLTELLYSDYYITERYVRNVEPKDFTSFYNVVESLNNYYKQIFSKDFYSPMADFIIKRIPENFDKVSIVEADLLCYYIAALNEKRWFPITYVYKKEGDILFFRKLTSSRHFEKVKSVFNVNTSDELKAKLKNWQEKNLNRTEIGYSNSFNYVDPIDKVILIDKIATGR